MGEGVSAQTPPRYRVVDLGTLAPNEDNPFSRAFGINQYGEVVGETMLHISTESVDVTTKRAFVWIPDRMESYPSGFNLDPGMYLVGTPNLGSHTTDYMGLLDDTQGQTSLESYAHDINQWGHITGTSEIDIDSAIHTRAFLYAPNEWSSRLGAGMHDLGVLVEDGFSHGRAITEPEEEEDQFWVVGWGLWEECGFGINETRGFKWDSDGLSMSELNPNSPNPAWNTPSAMAYDITGTPPGSETNVFIAGEAGESCEDLAMTCNNSPMMDAVHWEVSGSATAAAKEMEDTFDKRLGETRGTNDNYEFVGWAIDFSDNSPSQNDCIQSAAFWADENPATDPVNLGDTAWGVPSLDETHAEAINNNQQIVGWNSSVFRAVLWEKDGSDWVYQNLNDLVDASLTEWVLREAHDINDEGWIAGVGRIGQSSDDRAFVLIPIDYLSCPPDLNDDGTVNVLDLLLMLGAWGDCGSGGICWADLTGDGTVNVLDLLIMLELWGPCGDPEPENAPDSEQDCWDLFPNDPEARQDCIDALTEAGIIEE